MLNFARFEERCKEFERARVIFQYALGWRPAFFLNVRISQVTNICMYVYMLGQLGDTLSISSSEEFMSDLKKVHRYMASSHIHTLKYFYA